MDGYLRVLALKELGLSVDPVCSPKMTKVSPDNHQINLLSTIAEIYMIRRSIDWGVSRERLTRALNVNLSSTNLL